MRDATDVTGRELRVFERGLVVVSFREQGLIVEPLRGRLSAQGTHR